MLTPEQAQDLVDHFGSQRAAARSLDLSRDTIRRWMNPRYAERDRARCREWRHEKRANDTEWAERDRERKRAQYDSLTGFEYNRLMLRKRRREALARIRDRNNKED